MTTPYSYAAGGKGPVVTTGYPVRVQPMKFNPPNFKDSLNPELQYKGVPPQAPKKDHRVRDIFWALLFYAHLIGMVACTVIYAPTFLGSLNESWEYGHRLLLGRFLQNDEQEQQQDYNNNNADDDDVNVELDVKIIAVAIPICAFLGLVISTAALGFMMAFAETLVKISLLGTLGLFLAMTVVTFLIGSVSSGVMFLVITVFMAYYTCRVWTRIPFAASNLRTSCTAVQANLGLAFYAYLSVALVFMWTIWWLTATLSTIYVISDCQIDGTCNGTVNGGIVFLFVLSYYWTVEVISNVVHCTTSGTVGHWWFAPHEANGLCSKAVRESYWRSLTYSFGSICFASLIVAVIQAIREVIHSLRENGDSFIACCAECLIACIESVVEIFNRFALVYCAIHGQSFLEAGRSVMDLFKARGWTAIITDYMVDTVLTMVCIGVGILIGIVALIIAAAMQAANGMLGVAFVIGLVVGYAVCATLFSIVSSAVNTVIVCYAEAPEEFHRNHPELSDEMRASWRQAWPNDFSY